MANLVKMEDVFNELIEQFKGAEDAHQRHVCGGGSMYIENMNITKQRVTAFKKRFADAKAEV